VPRNPGGAAAPARASRSLDKPAAPDQGGKAAKGLRSGSAAGPRSAHRAGAGTRGRACRRDRGMRPVRHSSQVRAHWSAGRTRWSSGRGAAPRAASTAARLKRAYSASRLRSERARACAASSSSCSSSSCACRANRSESQRKGGAPRDSGLSRSPRSLHGCMPRTRVTTSPAVRLLACAVLDSVQAGLAGRRTWQRGVRLQTGASPALTATRASWPTSPHTCAQHISRSWYAKRSATARLHINMPAVRRRSVRPTGMQNARSACGSGAPWPARPAARRPASGAQRAAPPRPAVGAAPRSRRASQPRMPLGQRAARRRRPPARARNWGALSLRLLHRRLPRTGLAGADGF